MVVASEAKGQRVKKLRKAYCNNTTSLWGIIVLLTFQLGHTFVLADLASKGRGHVVLLLSDPGQIVRTGLVFGAKKKRKKTRWSQQKRQKD